MLVSRNCLATQVMTRSTTGTRRIFCRRSVFSAQYMGGVPGIAAPDGGTPIKDIESWSVYRLKDGKIVEHWGLNDGFAIAMQAGALEMPQMEAPAGR